MAVDASFVKDIAPDLASEVDARVERFIELAALSVNRTTFGAKADLATAVYAAHLMTLSNRGGAAAGPVVSERVGDVSRSYAAPSTKDDGALDSTNYGKWFKQIRRECYTGPQVI